MEPSRPSAEEACSSCSTTTTSSPLHSSFSSADATAVNTAAPTRRNSLSHHSSSPPTASGSSSYKQQQSDAKASKATHEGVSPKCLAQRLLQQQYPNTFPATTKLESDAEEIETCPHTLVANSPRTSFEKSTRPKLDEKLSGSFSSSDSDDIEKALSPATSPTSAVSPAPDGGLQAWLVVAAPSSSS